MFDSWRTAIAADWAAALEPVAPTLARIGRFLEAEKSAGQAYLPADSHILRAFERPMADARVLLVGQDPYPTPGDAVGLAFSTAPGRPMPRSLRNIARELREDNGEEMVGGDLTAWADQGVLMLNRVLTVRAGAAGSHRGQGWEQVTEHVIRALAARGGPLVAVLWGRDAQKLAPLLGSVPYVASAHPSPLSASRGFFGSRPFSQVNQLLDQQGAGPVSWGSLP